MVFSAIAGGLVGFWWWALLGMSVEVGYAAGVSVLAVGFTGGWLAMDDESQTSEPRR